MIRTRSFTFAGFQKNKHKIYATPKYYCDKLEVSNIQTRYLSFIFAGKIKKRTQISNSVAK